MAVKAPVVFTKAELEGVPDIILDSPGVKTGDDAYTILANVTFHYNTVEESAKSEKTRKHLDQVRSDLAREKNVPVLNDILAHRNKIALQARLQIVGRFPDGNQAGEERRRAPKPSSMISSLAFSRSSTPRSRSCASSRSRKRKTRTRRSTSGTGATYQNQLKKEKYTVDTEALRVYFPFQRTLEGMFDIYQSIFGLKFEQDHRPV